MRNRRRDDGEKKSKRSREPLSTSVAARTARRRLLTWYDAHRRDLPWRRTSDPYRVLLSEVMLQQTRVEVVCERYERFLECFPTLESLALADEQEVLAAWSGLGYYRRARHLRSAAREIVRRGAWPRTAAELEDLPGIGRYTAAAVASIAFGEAVAVVDGNVERLAARLLALAEDPRARGGRERIRELATRLVDPARAGDSNQALMELGATLCRPRAPACPSCPLATTCKGRASGAPAAFPPRRRRAARRRERHVVVVVERDARVLLVRRDPGAELLAGLWELPWVDASADDRYAGADDRYAGADDRYAGESDACAALARRYGGRWRIDAPLARVRHAITVRDLELVVCRGGVELGEAVAEGRESGFFDHRERRALGTSSMVDKVLEAVAQGDADAQQRLPLEATRLR